MGWKCSGCRAVMMDNCKICEYCGNIRLIERRNFNSENTNFRQSNGFIDDINNLVDPGKNYKSQENSIKPEFSSSSSPDTGLIVGCIVALIFFYIIIT